MGQASSLSGGCHCGNLRLAISLSRTPQTYQPRACDCEFCTRHAAAYISDAQGSLAIHVKDASRLARYRQGSGQAEFLLCSDCGVLAAVIHESEGRRYGAVNARAFGGGESFGTPQPASPKTLSSAQKIARWQEVWFPDVELRLSVP